MKERAGANGGRFLDRIGIRVPIIQAPMAGVSSPAMAAAASQAGGLGSIAVGAVGAPAAAALIDQVRERTDRPFNVNLFCHAPPITDRAIEDAWIERLRPEFERFGAEPPTRLQPVYASFLEDDEMLSVLVAKRPRVASFHFGLPRHDQISALRECGIVLLATATSPSEAESIVGAGLDAVIAQGWEAGGHRGVFDPDAADDRLTTAVLTRLLVRRIDVPVIAAGGIMDGAGIAAAIALGADAAQLGTAFIAARESLADDGYRAVLASSSARHTTMTRAISGRPARCLANRFTALGDGLVGSIPAYPIAYDAGRSLHAIARLHGEHGYGAHWAGQGASLAHALSTEELMHRLVEEWMNTSKSIA